MMRKSLKGSARRLQRRENKMPSSEISIFDESGTTFKSADTGSTSKEESVPVVTDADATYDTSNNKVRAYSFTKPTNFPIHARGNASVSEVIYPEGSLSETYERYAEFTISGEFRSRIAAYGSASASYDVELFLVDATNKEEIDRKTVASRNANFAQFSDIDDESFEDSVSGTLQQYTEYRVGLEIKTFAANRTLPTAPTPFASGINMHEGNSSPFDSFEGYAEWDSIDLDWVGEAEKI
ncbi:hypothetical protein HTG_05380 [Natrinema mahii]|nr:hypothetical protein HTG_05380 [Natrinema mahii]